MSEDTEPGNPRIAPGSPSGVEKVLSLMRHVGSLAREVEFERSFKTTNGQLFQDRFLIGIARPADANDLGEAIAEVCTMIGMPPELQESFGRLLPSANHVYFGAEKDDQSLIFKAYLEFRDSIEHRLAVDNGHERSFPLYTGFKWDASNPTRQAVSQYVWHRLASATAILQRLRLIAEPASQPVLWGVASRIVERAVEVISPEAIQYLEVREEGNPRRSFDINVYKAGYLLRDLRPLLLEVIAHHAVAPGKFDSLYERISEERVGHLAGGVDRAGRGFLTLYYGGVRLHGSQLRSVAAGAR